MANVQVTGGLGRGQLTVCKSMGGEVHGQGVHRQGRGSVHRLQIAAVRYQRRTF